MINLKYYHSHHSTQRIRTTQQQIGYDLTFLNLWLSFTDPVAEALEEVT
jgi:hypothetical protein